MQVRLKNPQARLANALSMLYIPATLVLVVVTVDLWTQWSAGSQPWDRPLLATVLAVYLAIRTWFQLRRVLVFGPDERA